MKTILGMFMLCTVGLAVVAPTISQNVLAADTVPRRIKIMPLGTSITASCGTCPSHRYYVWKTMVDSGIAERVDFVGPQCGVGDHQNSEIPVVGPCGTPPYLFYKGNEWDWDHCGLPANAIPDILDKFNSLITQDIPDITCIELGTNDLGLSPVDLTAADMVRLIDSLRSYNPSMAIMIGLVPPNLRTSVAKTIALNAKYQEIALAKTTPVSPLIIVDQFTGFNTATMLQDEVHTNVNGQIFMGQVWSNALLPLIKASFAAAPIVTFGTAPANGSTLEAGMPVSLGASAASFAGITSINFYFNGDLAGTGLRVGNEFTCIWTPVAEVSGDLHAEAVDFFGGVASSDTVEITVTPGTILDRTIMQVQGTGFQSPIAGRRVRTTGIMTLATADSSTFWMQDPAGDGNQLTSDGIAVDFSSFTDKNVFPRQQDLVRIVGTVQEFRTDNRNEPVTRISQLDSVIILSRSNPFPGTFYVTQLPGSPSSGNTLKQQFEQREGMILRITNAVVTGPTDSRGLFSVALPSNRTSGSSFFQTSRGPSFVTLPWYDGSVDYNTECLLIGTATLPVKPLSQPGDTIYQSFGVLDYAYGNYLLQPAPDFTTRSASRPLHSTPVGGGSVKRSTTIRVISINMGGLYDTLNATDRHDPAVTAALYERRMNKIVTAFINELILPEVVCIQGIETDEILRALAVRINKASTARYKTLSQCEILDAYPSFGGASPSTGLACGLLFDSTRCSPSEPLLLNGIPFNNRGYQPLVTNFFIFGQLANWTVINFSLAEREQLDDPLFGINQPPLRPSEDLRSQQAQKIRQYINSLLTADPNARIIVTGNFDDLPFNEADEISCAMSIVKGTAGSGVPVLTSVVDAQYYSPWNLYTTLKDGRFEMTSNIMVSPALLPYASNTRIHHFNAGFDRYYDNSSSTAVRAFTDDPVEVEFRDTY